MNRNYHRRRSVHSTLKATKVKVNNFLSLHLNIFETKLKSNRLNRFNTQVPLLIINKFKRLLKIWNENTSFSRYLKRDILEDINSSVKEILKHCDCTPAITQTNTQMVTYVEQHTSNILDNSYAILATQFQNLDNSRGSINEIIKRMTEIDENDKGTFFRCFLCQISIPVNDDGNSNNEEKIENRCLYDVIVSHEQDEEHRFNLLKFQSHENYIRIHNVKENMFRCILCGDIFHLHLLMKHFADSRHTKSEIISISQSSRQDLNSIPIEFVIHIINDEGIFTKCYLCRIMIPVPTSTSITKSTTNYFDDMTEIHKSSEIHSFNLLVFYSHWPYVKIHHDQENVMSCTLCNTMLDLDSLMDHLSSSKHTKLKLLSTCNLDVESFNELRINFIAQTIDDEGISTTCHLCRTTICSGEPNADTIDEHQRNVDHRFSFLVYKSHEPFVKVLNHEKSSFQCTLCNQVFFLDSLMDHFTDFEHTKLKLLSNFGV